MIKLIQYSINGKRHREFPFMVYIKVADLLCDLRLNLSPPRALISNNVQFVKGQAST